MKKFASYYDGTFDEEDLELCLASKDQAGLMSPEDKAKLDSLTAGGSEETEPVSIEASAVVCDPDHRFVSDVEKTAWNSKANNVVACDTENGLMTKEDKVKLDGMEAGANKYVHPVAHEAAMITQDADHRFVSDAQIAAWDAPVAITKEDIGLGNVTNDEQVKRSEMGAANGVATLDDTGKVPAAQLPAYVDDVLEFPNSTNFPIEGEAGKIYVDMDTNKTYRWSGSQYSPMGDSIALGETSSTAYAGDKGKAVADEVALIKDGTTVIPKAADAATVSGFSVASNVPADAVFTDTIYTHPESHEATMIVEDESHRFATDIEKASWNAKAENVMVSGTVDGLMSKEDKIKLDGVEVNANNYAHPGSHPASMIVEDESHRFVSDAKIAEWDAKMDIDTDTTYEVATPEADGLMAAADKAKLDDIPHDMHEEPYAVGNTLYACGFGVIVEASETEGMNKASWVGKNGRKSVEFEGNSYIYGGGDTMSKPFDYSSTNITVNSGTYRVIYGGNKGHGSVGKATIVINGGKFVEGINGGNAAYVGKDTDSAMGSAEIIINNNEGQIVTVFGGSMGAAGMVGNAKITVNGGNIGWLTAGGSNGHTSIGEVTVNGGSVTVLQGCNRGTMGNIKLAVNGGNISKVYAGGETEDKNVTATYAKSEVSVTGGVISAITAGTNGGVADASKVSGTYVDGAIDDAAASVMNLAKVVSVEKLAAGLITSAVLEGKTLVLKNSETVIASVDLSAVAV